MVGDVGPQVVDHLDRRAVGGHALGAAHHGFDNQRQRIGPLLGLREVAGRQAEHVTDQAHRQRLGQRGHQIESGLGRRRQCGQQVCGDGDHTSAQRLHYGRFEGRVHQPPQPRVRGRVVEQHPALACSFQG